MRATERDANKSVEVPCASLWMKSVTDEGSKQKYEVSIMLVLLMFSPGHEEDHGDEEAEDDGEERGERHVQPRQVRSSK